MASAGDTATDNELSDEQQHIFDKVVHSRESCFFTGAAGSGKSHLLRSIVQALKQLLGNAAVCVTASTGVAACNIGGVTVHSFGGIGNGRGGASGMCDSAMRSQHACKRWRQCAVLVIDEISMLNAEAFDGLDLAAKGCRRDNAHPFGGLQLLVAGDFYQLPPVSGEFCFTSSAWQSLFPRGHNVHVLRHIFRQRDSSFIRLLNQVRRGVVTPRVERTLQSADRLLGSDAHAKLFSHNRDADQHNTSKLLALSTERHVYAAQDTATQSFIHRQLQKHCKAPPKLELRIGAQVMLLKNLRQREGLVNGTRGEVIGFQKQRRSATDVQLFDSCNGSDDDEGSGTSSSHLSAAFEQLRKGANAAAKGTGADVALPVVRFDCNGGSRTLVISREQWRITSGDRDHATR